MSDENLVTDVEQPAEGMNMPAAIATPEEKMVPQSEVDKIVHARLMREREKMLNDGRNAQQSMGGMQPGVNKDEMLEAVDERIRRFQDEQMAAYEREQQQAEAKVIAEKFVDSMERGKTLYDDYQEVTENVTPKAYPAVTIMASQYDNMPEILYELGSNPTKLVHLHVLALSNPEHAKKEMAKLSQSIKNNEQALASNQKSPKPLSRLKSSVVAGQDNGKRTIRDLRRDPRFKV